MKKIWSLLRSIFTGGILFLVPFLVILLILNKGMDLARRLSRPIVNLIGIDTVGGVALSTLLSILGLTALALVAGLFARTVWGQKCLSSMETSILSALPQFNLAHGFLQGLDPESKEKTKVVLVPTDAGWALGIVFEEPDGDWWSVFVPSAPQWSSGSIVYAHKDDVRITDFNLKQAIVLMRECGAGSAKVRGFLQGSPKREEA